MGDGTGAVAVLGDRDCSLQRGRQKLVEIAPAPIRTRSRGWPKQRWRWSARPAMRGWPRWNSFVQDDTIAFAEVNPRLQVEHTVTEQVTGLDLVG